MSRKNQRKSWGATTPSGRFIEHMPQEDLHLRMTGHLMASECEELGFLPLTMCSQCGIHPLDIIYRHSAYTDDEIFNGKHDTCECGKIHGKIMPGTVWGEDVTCICACCSFDHCTHRAKKVSAA